MIKRLSLAFLLAPAAPLLLDALLRVAKAMLAGDPVPGLAQLFSPFFLMLSYFCASVIGIPVYLLLRRFLGAIWWRYVVCAALVGCVPAMLIMLGVSGGKGSLEYGIALVAVAIGGTYGAVGGWVFWAIGVAPWGRKS